MSKHSFAQIVFFFCLIFSLAMTAVAQTGALNDISGNELAEQIKKVRVALESAATPPNLLLEQSTGFLNGVRKYFALGIASRFRSEEGGLDKYNEYYYAARAAQNLSRAELNWAQYFLNQGANAQAREHLSYANAQQRLWQLYDTAAFEVYNGNIAKAKSIEQEAGKTINSAIGFTGHVIGAVAEKTGNRLVQGLASGLAYETALLNVGIDAGFQGLKEGVRTAIKDAAIDVFAEGASRELLGAPAGAGSDAASALKLGAQVQSLQKALNASTAASAQTLSYLENEIARQKLLNGPNMLASLKRIPRLTMTSERTASPEPVDTGNNKEEGEATPAQVGDAEENILKANNTAPAQAIPAPTSNWKTIDKPTFTIKIPEAWKETRSRVSDYYASAFRLEGTGGEYFEVGIDPKPVGLGSVDQIWLLESNSSNDAVIIKTVNTEGTSYDNLFGEGREYPSKGNGKLEIHAIINAIGGDYDFTLQGRVYDFSFGNNKRETGVDTEIFKTILNSFRAKKISAQQEKPPKLQTEKLPQQPTPVIQSSTKGKIIALAMSQNGEPINQARFWLVDPQGRNPDPEGYNFRYTTDTGKIETPPLPNGKYVLKILCGINCIFSENNDPYDRWSKEVDVEIYQQEIDLGKIALKKWTKVKFRIVNSFGETSPFFGPKIKDDTGQDADTSTLLQSAAGYSVSLPDGNYTLRVDASSENKLLEKDFSATGGTLDLGAMKLEKQ